jgi:hypothetical protein
MLRTVNRVVLALAGLGLLALGGGVLLGGLDLPQRWGFDVPGWWPFTGADDVVLGDEGRTRFRDDGWWWPAVFAALTVLLLLVLWWLLAQVRRRRIGAVQVDSGDGSGALVRGRALEAAMAADAEALDGVLRADVALTGRRRTGPAARLEVVLEPHAGPARTLDGLTRVTLGRVRDSTGLERLPADVRMRALRHSAERVA